MSVFRGAFGVICLLAIGLGVWQVTAAVSRGKKCGVATSAHADWLQQGGPAALAQPSDVGEHPTVLLDWASPPAQRSRRLVEALRRDGVCVLVNHSLNGLEEQGVALAETLFKARRAWSGSEVEYMQSDLRDRPIMKTAVGLTALRVEQLNPHQPADFKETFDYADSVPSCPDVALHMGAPIWPLEREPHRGRAPVGKPEVAPGFKRGCLEFLKSQRGLAEEIIDSIGQGLGLGSDALANNFRDPLVVGRLIEYPPQSDADVPGELGAGSHVDYGAVTLIIEESAGLHMHDRDKSQWRRVPHVPGGIIVQTGYALEKLTNGYLRAARHRVRNDGVKGRKAAVVFYDPTPTVEIGPLPYFVDAAHPARYEKCVAGKKGVRFGDPRYLSSVVADS
eukprot:Hpha_TRINITY_DN10807_c0_g1::TRINITY_DN10807_c0_g1_i1::g.23388::m.23388